MGDIITWIIYIILGFVALKLIGKFLERFIWIPILMVLGIFILGWISDGFWNGLIFAAILGFILLVVIGMSSDDDNSTTTTKRRSNVTPQADYSNLTTSQAYNKSVDLINSHILRYSDTEWMRPYIEYWNECWKKWDGVTVQHYSNGFYFGEVRNGRRNGAGCYVWNDRSIFVGEWEDGDKHGDGINADGKGYVEFTHYEHDRKVNQSTIRYSSGKTDHKWL